MEKQGSPEYHGLLQNLSAIVVHKIKFYFQARGGTVVLNNWHFFVCVLRNGGSEAGDLHFVYHKCLTILYV